MTQSLQARRNKKVLKKLLDQRQKVVKNLLGVMGDGMGHLRVANDPGYVYITLEGVPCKALCTKVPPKYGKSVWVGLTYEAGKPGKVYQVLSDNFTNATETSLIEQAGYAPASRYMWGGPDPLTIQLRAFAPLRIGVNSGGMLVDLYPGFLTNGADRFEIVRQDVDVSTHLPVASGKAAFVLITIDTSGAIVQTKGGEVDIGVLDLVDIPVTPEDTLFECGAVRVYTGQTAVQEGKVNTDFVDLRFPGYSASGVGVSTDGSLSGNGTLASLLSTASGETTASAAGTTAMTVSSATVQELTGTTTQTHTLPVTSTLRLGQTYVFINNSTGAWTINSSGGNEVVVLAAGKIVIIYCILITGTTTASWSVFSGDEEAVPNTTAENDMIFGGGGDDAGTWLKKTLAEGVAILRTALDPVFAPIAKGVTNGDSHNHVGGDGAVLYFSDIVGTNAGSTKVSASTTSYLMPFFNSFVATGSLPWPVGGTLKNMYVRTGGTQPATGSLVITLQVQGSDTALTITIAAGATYATFSDLTHTVTLNAGETLRWKFVNNASSDSAAVVGIVMELEQATK